VRIRRGDVVGVVAPSGAIEEARLGAGIAVLEGLGLRVVTGDAVLARRGYLAGPDTARGADLQRMLDDPDIRAIFCARGGFGSQRIVPTLDLTRLRRRPKPVVGYSDATALLIALARANVVGVHGPMVAVDLARGLTARSLAHLERVLGDPGYLWDAEVPVAIRPGRATGRLLGGTLSVLVTTLGTPYAPELDGAIVFLEDVHEWPYRLDRLLTQLRQSGKLDRAAGVVFGTMEACRALDGVTAIDVIRDVFAEAAYPVGLGVPAGHTAAHADVENLALPFGVQVELDVDGGKLTALESAVV
jgi:muramoyltetrapeptide carboxypeptidase